ncbi:hypothetical protein OHB49_42580 (plasmid) [Streptomyces sp. NBC_01717]|nr:hypothetical protein [Streptomyces sp. NBC_01717]
MRESAERPVRAAAQAADDLLHVIVPLVENESLLPYDSASALARAGAAPH